MEPRKHAARILPDSPAFAYGVLASVVAIFLAACVVSMRGQAAMAETYMGLQGFQAYLVPVIVDVSLLVYAAAALVRRARGQSVKWVVAASAFWVGVSIAGNIVHALQPQSIFVGAALSVLAPLAILMSSVTLESLLVAPVATGEKLDREADLAAELAASQVTVAGHVKENDLLQKRIEKLEVAAKLNTPTASTPAAKPLAAVPALPAEDDREARDDLIRELRAAGETIPAIAAQTGVSVSSVKRAVKAA